jgi:predicted RND superfamily exporter protein
VQHLYGRVRRFRALILCVWGVVSVAGALALALNFRIDNSVGVWWPDDDPTLAQYDWYLEEFGEWEWTLVLLETEDINDPRFLSELNRLTADLGKVTHVRRSLSLTNVPEVPDSLARLYPDLNPEKLFLRPGDERYTVVLLETANFIRRADPYRPLLLRQIHETVESYPCVISHWVAGTSVINVQLNETAKRDMFVFFSLVGVLLFAISLILFRSWRDTLILTSVAFSSAAITLGFIVLCGYSLNIITIMLPTVIIALSVADLVHLIYAFHDHRRSTTTPAALDQTIRELWLPCLGTSVTTIAGFLSLSGSTMLPVFQLAVFSAFGIGLAWVLSLTVAPLLLGLLWSAEGPCRTALLSPESRPLVALARGLPRRIPLVMGLFAIASLGLWGLPRLETDTNYVTFFRQGNIVPETYERIESAGFPQNPVSVVLITPRGAALAGEALQAFEETLVEFEEGIRSLEEVEFVFSPFTNAKELDGFVTEDGRKHQLVLLTDFMGSREISELKQKIYRLKQEILPPEIGMIVTGSPVLWTSMDENLANTQRSSIAIVTIVALIVLTVIFQSIGFAALGCLVSFFPVALILGLMGLLNVPISLATVLIAGIAVGLAVDDTIHFVFAYREGRRAGLTAEVATRQTLVRIGSRMIVTSLILVGSFGCMAVSDFMPSANFGVFTALTILAALIVDLTLLPLALRATARLPGLFSRNLGESVVGPE